MLVPYLIEKHSEERNLASYIVSTLILYLHMLFWTIIVGFMMIRLFRIGENSKMFTLVEGLNRKSRYFFIVYIDYFILRVIVASMIVSDVNEIALFSILLCWVVIFSHGMAAKVYATCKQSLIAYLFNSLVIANLSFHIWNNKNEEMEYELKRRKTLIYIGVHLALLLVIIIINLASILISVI